MEDSRTYMFPTSVKEVEALGWDYIDVILFTGDLQNRQPSELDGSSSILSRLHAPDGVYSVFGNHDYPDYLRVPLETKLSKFMELIDREEKMGWKVLLNSHATIRRGTDSLIILNSGVGNRIITLKICPVPYEGAGSEENPYLLKTKDDLIKLSKYTSIAQQLFPDTYFKITKYWSNIKTAINSF